LGKTENFSLSLGFNSDRGFIWGFCCRITDLYAFYAFAGVEVKNGKPLHLDPGLDRLVHISQVLLNLQA